MNTDEQDQSLGKLPREYAAAGIELAAVEGELNRMAEDFLSAGYSILREIKPETNTLRGMPRSVASVERAEALLRQFKDVRQRRIALAGRLNTAGLDVPLVR